MSPVAGGEEVNDRPSEDTSGDDGGIDDDAWWSVSLGRAGQRVVTGREE